MQTKKTNIVQTEAEINSSETLKKLDKLNKLEKVEKVETLDNMKNLSKDNHLNSKICDNFKKSSGTYQTFEESEKSKNSRRTSNQKDETYNNKIQKLQKIPRNKPQTELKVDIEISTTKDNNIKHKPSENSNVQNNNINEIPKDKTISNLATKNENNRSLLSSQEKSLSDQNKQTLNIKEVNINPNTRSSNTNLKPNKNLDVSIKSAVALDHLVVSANLNLPSIPKEAKKSIMEPKEPDIKTKQNFPTILQNNKKECPSIYEHNKQLANTNEIKPQPNMLAKHNDNNYEKVEKIFNSHNNEVSIITSSQPIIYALFIAEKPSIAEKISQVFSGQDDIKPYFGNYYPYKNFYEFPGKFQNMNATFIVSSVAGHLYRTEFSEGFEISKGVCPFELFDASVEKILEKGSCGEYKEHIQKLSEDINHLVLCLDNDNEGENICYEIINLIKDYYSEGGYGEQFKNIKIHRMIFSSLNPIDLKKALSDLTIPNEKISKSVDARQIIDLKLGCAFTRFFTSHLRKYFDIEKPLISFGPCQTPTLGFCFDRYLEIMNFKEKDLFYLQIIIKYNCHEIKLKSTKLSDQKEIQKFASNLNKRKIILKIEKILEEETVKHKPFALNSVQLYKYCSEKFKMSSFETSSIAETLYEEGLISYPRTETSSYPETFDFDEVNAKLFSNGNYSEYVDLINHTISELRNGEDQGDHPPITPTNYNGKIVKNLGSKEKLVYDYIVKHYFASQYIDTKETKYTICWNVYGENFTTHIYEIKKENEGFYKILNCNDRKPNIAIEKLKSTYEKFSISKMEMVAKTKPKQLLKESELIQKMEKEKIGTDGSIPQHIKNLIIRGYVVDCRYKKTLKLTPLGIAFATCLSSIEESFLKPELRSDIENSISKIGRGETDIKEILKYSLDKYKSMYLLFEKNTKKLETVFKSVLEENQERNIVVGSCFSCPSNILYESSYSGNEKQIPFKCHNCSKKYQFKDPNFESVILITKSICKMCNSKLVYLSYNDNYVYGCLICKKSFQSLFQNILQILYDDESVSGEEEEEEEYELEEEEEEEKEEYEDNESNGQSELHEKVNEFKESGKLKLEEEEEQKKEDKASKDYEDENEFKFINKKSSKRKSKHENINRSYEKQKCSKKRLYKHGNDIDDE